MMWQSLSSLKNPKIKDLRAFFKGQAQDASLLVIEGQRSCQEALEALRTDTSSFAIEALWVSSSLKSQEVFQRLIGRYQSLLSDVACYEVKDFIFEQMSEQTSTQGLMLSLRDQGQRNEAEAFLKDYFGLPEHKRWPLILLDGVQDPGNVGTLFRSAKAFCSGGVICGHGTARVLKPKVLRSSLSSVLQVPFLEQVDLPAFVEAFRALGGEALALDLDGLSLETFTKQRAMTPKKPFALVLGNEGAGISKSLRAACDRAVTIPMPGGFESLNVGVAGAIALYHFGVLS